MKPFQSACRAGRVVAVLLAAVLWAGGVQAEGQPTVTSMYSGLDGLTYLRDIPLSFEPMNVVRARFGRSAVGDTLPPHVMDWHTAPNRRYVVTISGKAEIEVSGEARRFVADADHILLAEDLTGKGHRYVARPVGPDPWIYVFLELE